MNLLNIAFVNIKRFLKTPQIIGVLVMQVVFILLFSTSATSGKVIGNINIINNDNGVYSEALIDVLRENYAISIFSDDSEIEENQVIVYISENYSKDLQEGKKPKVKIKGPDENSMVSAVVHELESFSNTKLKSIYVEGYNNNFFTLKNESEKEDHNPMIFLMLCYFMLIGGSLITEDTMKLKNGNVLKRALTTANSHYVIIGGLFLAMLFLQWILTGGIFIIANNFVNFGISIPKALLLIFAMSALATSICLFTVRVVKNQAVSSMVGVAYAVVAFLFLFLDLFKVGGEIVTKLSMIFPFYWIQNVMVGGSVIASVCMILLMAAVFFTAGGFRYNNFINKI